MSEITEHKRMHEDGECTCNAGQIMTLGEGLKKLGYDYTARYRILHAVNSYEALLELVRQAYDRFTDNDMMPPNHALCVWLERAQASIAQAEKGA